MHEGNHSFRGIQRTPIHAEHVALAPRGRIIDEGGRERLAGWRRWRTDAAAIRGIETRLDRPREFDVPRREKEASKSENDLSCRLRRTAPCGETSLGEA